MSTTFCLEVDWDHDGTWTDESAFVRRVQCRSGFAGSGDPVAEVGRCLITLDNTTRRFSPGNTAGALYGNLIPRRAVRVRAISGAQNWTLFRGFIERLEPDTGVRGAGDVRLVCVDAMALLARQRISVAHAESKVVSAAVADIVATVYTPPATAYTDNGDSLDHYGHVWQPERTTALDALREIAEAVYGRFYVARDGTPTFITRGQLQNPAIASAATFGEGVT